MIDFVSGCWEMCGVMYECCQGVMRGVENVWPGISMITDCNLTWAVHRQHSWPKTYLPSDHPLLSCNTALTTQFKFLPGLVWHQPHDQAWRQWAAHVWGDDYDEGECPPDCLESGDDDDSHRSLSWFCCSGSLSLHVLEQTVLSQCQDLSHSTSSNYQLFCWSLNISQKLFVITMNVIPDAVTHFFLLLQCYCWELRQDWGSDGLVQQSQQPAPSTATLK